MSEKKLVELIDDYAHAMYDAGENMNPDDNYYPKQIGKTYRALHAYIKKMKLED